ncbi:oligosaccharide flippase family protein [Neisseriaceae bacterium CLB008]
MNILRDSVIYVGGEVLSKLLPFLLLPYLTRQLGPEGFGMLSYLQAWIAVAVIILSISQDGAITRYYYFYGKRSLSIVVQSGVLYTLTLACLVSLFALATKSQLILYIGLAATAQSLLNAQLSIWQCQKKPLIYTALQFTHSIFAVSFTLILFYFIEASATLRILAMFLGAAAASSIAFYYYLKFQPYRAWPSYRQLILGLSYLIGFGSPLLLHHLSFFIKGQFDKMFIYEFFDAAILGIYSAGFQLASIVSVLLMAINKAIVPYYYEALKKSRLTKATILTYSLLTLILTPIPSIIAYLLPESLYAWILGSSFTQAKWFTIWFLLGISINISYLILVNYLFYHGKNTVISICNLLSTGCYFVILILLSSIGIQWVPLALAISNIVLVALLFSYIKYYKPVAKLIK